MKNWQALEEQNKRNKVKELKDKTESEKKARFDRVMELEALINQKTDGSGS